MSHTPIAVLTGLAVLSGAVLGPGSPAQAASASRIYSSKAAIGACRSESHYPGEYYRVTQQLKVTVLATGRKARHRYLMRGASVQATRLDPSTLRRGSSQR